MSAPIDKLKAVPLFQGLGDAALGQIAEISTEFEAPAGRVLIEAGHAGSGMYVIEEGRVSVEHDGGVTRCGEGECVGELSLLTDAPRNARVRAETPVVALAISRQAFGELLDREPQIARNLLRILAERLT